MVAAQGRAVGVIACGAIARELVALARLNRWEHLHLHCLPAELHNRPQAIPGRVSDKLAALRGRYRRLFVAYADCGTGGRLDALLREHGIARLPGAHCYEFFAGSACFERLMTEEPGTFFLTDFLVRHFERLVIQGLGLDRHPALKTAIFAHYRRVVYLAQAPDEALKRQAASWAHRLELDFDYRFTGYGNLQAALTPQFQPHPHKEQQEILQWQN